MKNKKKLSVTLASLALVGVIGLGATLAYFTDNDAASNVITMGHVDIELVEPKWDENNPDGEIENVRPNQVIEKDPKILVSDDSEDAYIRAKISIEGLDATKVEEMRTCFNIDETKWVFGADGYFYYQDIVKAGEDVQFFTEVQIPEKWGNEIVNTTFNINVSAEAIQAENFVPTETDGKITAWRYEDGEFIKAQTYKQR